MICVNSKLLHQHLADLNSVLERFFVIIPCLHTHLNANGIVVVANSEKTTTIVDADMPCASIKRCSLISLGIINIYMSRVAGEVPVMLSLSMCLCVCSFCKVICIMDNDVFRHLICIAVVIAD